MKRIKISFRLNQDIYERLQSLSPNTSSLLRQMVVASLLKLYLPRQPEIDELVKMNEQIRKLAVNFNQSVRALNIAVSENEPLKTEVLNELQKTSEHIHSLRQNILNLIGKYYEG